MIDNYKSPQHLMDASEQIANIICELQSIEYTNFDGRVTQLRHVTSNLENLVGLMLEVPDQKWEDPVEGPEFQRLAAEAEEVEKMMALAAA